MHILFLTDNFPPEGNAPASRTYEHATNWVELGHKVTVITCAPNFPEGRVFDGYKNSFYQRGYVKGINVVRVKTYITANEGFVRRTLDYLSFMVSGFIGGLLQKDADVIVATSPQFFCACAGWALSVVKRKPFVFELRDIWPASITAVDAMNDGKIIRFLEKLELFLYKKADLIISVTYSFKRELVERGVDPEKIEVVLNGVNLSLFQPFTQKDPNFLEYYGLRNKFVVGYVGTHGMAHALENVVIVAEKLKENNDIVFLFAGGGAAKQNVVNLVRKKDLGNVVLIERQPKEMMPRIWSLCDVCVVPLKDTPLFGNVIPSKIFECMGMGIPMLMSVPTGEATSIIEITQSGLTVKPESIDEMYAAVLSLKADQVLHSELKRNCIYSSSQYSRRTQALKMIEKIEEICR